jgi:hypothetical protein
MCVTYEFIKFIVMERRHMIDAQLVSAPDFVRISKSKVTKRTKGSQMRNLITFAHG